MAGTYDQYCPIARGLDLIGDRWTLLVLRELSLAPQRFTDLRRRLEGIPPNVLSQRLKRLTEDGLVATEELPPPAARSVYVLTDRGRDVLPVLRSLVRFGMPDLEPATPRTTMSPGRIAPTMFLAWFDPAAAALVAATEHYDLEVDGEVVHLSSEAPRLRRRPEGEAAVVLTGPSWAFIRLRQGVSLAALEADGLLEVRGSQAARGRFARIYSLT